VSASVIGGWRQSSGEGYYLLNIETPRPGTDDVLAAIKRLRTFAQVAAVMLDMTNSDLSIVP
jgi:hypothetical protein